MLISTSSDFAALCREQIVLLTQGLGASLSIVYLTQELVESPGGETKLIPLVVYPDGAALTLGEEISMTTVGNVLSLQQGRLLAPGRGGEIPNAEPRDRHQVVLPLIYEGMMMGLLVTSREDRVWNLEEEGEIKRIAQTIAIACILDQRGAWLQHQLHEKQVLQAEQRDLLDNLLHQVRNPLTAIRTFGKLLLKRLRSGDANQDIGISIVRESDRIQELLQKFDQVLDLCEAEPRQFSLPTPEVFVEATPARETNTPLLLPGGGEKITQCYIPDILMPLLLSARAIAQERHIQLQTAIPEHLPLLLANVKALAEVLSNIIDNALKYTPSGGKIYVHPDVEKDNFWGIVISNTGAGIPLEDLARLGERHYRGLQAQTPIPGTGLGLAIAKQLLHQMHGEMEVFSPAIDSNIASPQEPGTSFIIWLPIFTSETTDLC